MAKENALTRVLHPEPEKEFSYNVWIEDRWIWYHPTFFPTPDVNEWGGRWDKKRKAWRLPRLQRMFQKISEYDPAATFGPGASAWLNWTPLDSGFANGLDYFPDSYQKLYPFQQIATDSLATRPFHGELLALSPGLGKTPTSIVAAELFMANFGDSQRALVVSPLPLVKNWMREITGTQLKNPIQWSADPRIEVLHQQAPTPDRSVRWSVTNYDSILERAKNQNGRTIVTGNLKEEFDLDWDVVIFDESVLLKNRKAKRVSAALSLARTAKKVWLLSGAPTTRDNSDIWQQFNIIEPDYFSSFWRFANEFCIVVRTQWSQGEILGSRKDIEVRDEFPDIMFVRNQEEVLPDLPEYIWQDVELELHPKQRKAHSDVMDVWLHELEENPQKRVEVTAVIAMLTRLQQITSNLYNLETTGEEWPDSSAKADYVEELLGVTGEVEWPVLIWTHHRPGARALLDRLRKHTTRKDSPLYGRRVELVYGGVRDGDALIEAFKDGEVDVLILGITVGKYGHTLVNTRTVITYDKTWDSDAWFQMLHRVRRNGLQHRPLVINPRCRGTVDDYVELNLAGKLPDMARITGADLAKILRSLGEEFVT